MIATENASSDPTDARDAVADVTDDDEVVDDALDDEAVVDDVGRALGADPKSLRWAFQVGFAAPDVPVFRPGTSWATAWSAGASARMRAAA